MSSLNENTLIDDGIVNKPQLDGKSHSLLKLRNGLKALIISDKKTDMSIVALSVNVGSLNDSEYLPGTAHFLEHLLFLGSKKYPKENDFTEFLSEHAGCSNAMTDEDETLFFFEVSANFLEPALDRFVQFFLEPLITPSAIAREVRAVDSEYEQDFHCDKTRINQLLKSLSKEGHPFKNFLCGNLHTLKTEPENRKIDVREKLLAFHSTWYSSNIMGLAVLGKESLDDLKRMVVSLFKEVENKNVVKKVYEEHAYEEEQVARTIYVVPVEDVRILKIIFPIPSYRHENKSSPDDYVSHLINHRGPGGLYSELRKRGLCNLVDSRAFYMAAGIALYVFEVDLTENAVNRTEEIVSLLFQYINFLKTVGIQQWIFEERRRLCKTAFELLGPRSWLSYMKTLASSMRNKPSENILAPDICDEWKPELIEELLKEYLNPDNMQIVIVSKSYEEIADRKEEWYETKHKIEPTPEHLIEKWRTIADAPAPSDAFKLPSPNEFIFPNSETQPLNTNGSGYRPTEFIKEFSLSRFFFELTHKYIFPHLAVVFELFSPTFHQDPSSSNMTAIFAMVLTDMLKEYFHDAELAHFEWKIDVSNCGLLMFVSGYNEKLPLLLEEIMRKMSHFEIDRSRFQILKEQYIRSLKNFEYRKPDEQAKYHLAYLTSERNWSTNELLAYSNVLQVDSLERFVSNMFSSVYIQGLIHGHCDEEKAMEIVNMIETPFTSKGAIGVLPELLLPLRQVRLEDGCHKIYSTFNHHHRSSCYYVYYQCDFESPRSNTLIELFLHIIKEPCHNVLRTQEQLGYFVSAETHVQGGVHGLTIIVQSKKHPQYLDSRVENFLQSVGMILENMSEEKFEAHKTALATEKLGVNDSWRAHWSEIESRVYNFEKEKEQEQLRLLEIKDVLHFYKIFIKKSSRKRRKLAIYVTSEVTNPPVPSNLQLERKAEMIVDVCVFKHSLSLSPLPLPYNHISPLGNKLET